jgi:hypothetical protein
LKEPSLSQHFRPFLLIFSRIFAILTTVLLLVGVILFVHKELSYPQDYYYEKLLASNGTELHIIRTTPDNIRLQTIDKNVTTTSYYGINGGFFWEGALLSIAVVNDQPIKGVPGGYGSGWYNTGTDFNLKRGTLVWDDIMKRFSIQVITQAGEITTTDKLHYWAQGGVSMGLGDELNWESEMILENMPSYDEGHMRTGIVYDKQQNLYMIVTPTLCTIEQFRTAILEKLGDQQLIDGIFLDGDGSSQLHSRYDSLAGDNRQVYQMLTLKK